MKNKKSKFPNADELTDIMTKKPERKKSEKKSKKILTMEQNKEGIFEVPQDVDEFQRPETVTLAEIGDTIDGLYEGAQPVTYAKTGNIGYLVLLRQRDGTLKSVNAGYDIKRWLFESGFDERFMGEYLRITLDKFVDTSQGKFAPMKQYRYGCRKDIMKQLISGGAKQSLAQLQAKNDHGFAVALEAKNPQKKEVWDKDED